MGRELFGTDGIRGLAGTYPLDKVGAEQVGRAIAKRFAQPGERIVIAADPRESSAGLVEAVTRGLIAVGINVTDIGVLPTPGLAYVTREYDDFMAGVMVTASHNPVQYNGIKVFDAHGDKLSDETETTLNKLIGQDIDDETPGQAETDESLAKSYEDFLVESAEGVDLHDLSLAVDSANGAASSWVERLFKRLGAQVMPLFDQPNGRNINDGCGATDIKALQQAVLDNRLALGIALDGDADRLIMVDQQGRAVNGDYVMYILAVSGRLDGVVTTVMSNLGLERSLAEHDIKLERTAVGDRYVLEGLAKTGYRLGGEQSGHIILPEMLKTGDGLLAAVQVVKALVTSGKTLAQWRDEMEIVPQALVNIELQDKSRLDSEDVQSFITEQEKQLGDSGRLLIRPSGTEPVARVMVEATDAQAKAEATAAKLKELL
jgi:phosphoglucosamine mutase